MTALAPPLKALRQPALPADKVRPVSRRSKPSSRSLLIGEQPHPWPLMQARIGRADIEVPSRGSIGTLARDEPVIPRVIFLTHPAPTNGSMDDR